MKKTILLATFLI